MPVDWHQRFTQQARWTEELRRYLLNSIDLSRVNSIIEIGIGTGAVLNSIQSLISSREGKQFQIFGLDVNLNHLQQAAKFTPDALLVCGDAHQLPYLDSAFDIAYCHFLLLWVANPKAVLEEMKRVIRSGGWIMALAEPDYGGRIDYPEKLIELGQLQEQALRLQGAETRVGRRLQGLFYQVGLESIDAGILGAQWRKQATATGMEQEWKVTRADLESILTQGEIERYYQLDKDAWESGERVLFVPTFYAIGQKG